MADILPNIGLSKLFSSRIRNYFLFLEVTNNIELICEITQYLNIRDLISFLSASTHTYSFIRVTNIQIRLLKAKVQYYQKPKIQPSFQFFVNFQQMKAPAPSAKIKGHKLTKDYECLKKLNQEFHISKRIKKIQNPISRTYHEKSQVNIAKQINQMNQQIRLNIYSAETKAKNLQNIEKNQKIQKNTQNPVRNRNFPQQMSVNLDFARFQEIEYDLAKKDFQRRKQKRLQQQKQFRYFMTVQQLKQMAVSNPCSRQILEKIEMEEMKKIQNFNAQLQKMKALKINQIEVQKVKFLPLQQRQKMVVVKASIVQKILTNITSFIRKQ